MDGFVKSRQWKYRICPDFLFLLLDCLWISLVFTLFSLLSQIFLFFNSRFPAIARLKTQRLTESLHKEPTNITNMSYYIYGDLFCFSENFRTDMMLFLSKLIRKEPKNCPDCPNDAIDVGVTQNSSSRNNPTLHRTLISAACRLEIDQTKGFYEEDELTKPVVTTVLMGGCGWKMDKPVGHAAQNIKSVDHLVNP